MSCENNNISSSKTLDMNNINWFEREDGCYFYKDENNNYFTSPFIIEEKLKREDGCYFYKDENNNYFTSAEKLKRKDVYYFYKDKNNNYFTSVFHK